MDYKLPDETGGLRPLCDCTLQFNRRQSAAKVIDISLRGALVVGDTDIDAVRSQPCRIFLDGRQAPLNGMVVNACEGMLEVKFIAVGDLDRETIERVARTGDVGVERHWAELAPRAQEGPGALAVDPGPRPADELH